MKSNLSIKPYCPSFQIWRMADPGFSQLGNGRGHSLLQKCLESGHSLNWLFVSPESCGPRLRETPGFRNTWHKVYFKYWAFRIKLMNHMVGNRLICILLCSYLENLKSNFITLSRLYFYFLIVLVKEWNKWNVQTTLNRTITKKSLTHN